MMTDEIMPTLPMDRADLETYRDRLLRRFANPALKHRTWQIAMDGSQKLPQRLLGTIRARLRGERGIERLALGVAGWMRYVTGIDEKDEPIDVKDPMAERLAHHRRRRGAQNPAQARDRTARRHRDLRRRPAPDAPSSGRC